MFAISEMSSMRQNDIIIIGAGGVGCGGGEGELREAGKCQYNCQCEGNESFFHEYNLLMKKLLCIYEFMPHLQFAKDQSDFWIRFRDPDPQERACRDLSAWGWGSQDQASPE